MKGNTVKVIILIILICVAYKSLKSNAKTLFGRSSQPPQIEEIAVEETPPTSFFPEGEDLTASGENTGSDFFMNPSGGERVPFIATQEQKESGTVSQEEKISSSKVKFDIPQVSTILNYDDTWFAIVNGNLVKEGDSFGKVKILEIGENFVQVQCENEVYQVKLWKDGLAR